MYYKGIELKSIVVRIKGKRYLYFPFPGVESLPEIVERAAMIGFHMKTKNMPIKDFKVYIELEPSIQIRDLQLSKHLGLFYLYNQ